tara:strand:- start:259 stop:1059 length:801 start_codon:yes stop_codon:yes gene_type:complete
LYGGFENRRSNKIIKAALDNDINYFDTAPRYGDSEKIIGKFLKGNHDVIISSKVGLNPINESLFKKNSNFMKRELKLRMKNNFKFAEHYLNKKLKKRYDNTIYNLNNFIQIRPNNLVLSQKEIKYSLHKTLNNLQRNYLDVLFLHEPDQYSNINEIQGIFNDLKQEGLIKNYGLGFHRWLNNKDNFNSAFLTLSMFKKDMIYEESYNSEQIFIHGAMGYYKFGLDINEIRKYQSPLDFMRKLTTLHPNATFLIAPSNHYQLIDFVV